MRKTCLFFKSSGFTLVELLIAVAIISTLMGLSVMVINPNGLRNRIRDTQRQKDLEIVSLALEQYYADNNKYPNTDYEGLEAALTAGSTVYLKNLPNDPSDTPTDPYSYCYYSASTLNNQNFVMCAVQQADTADNSSPDALLPACNTTPLAQTSSTLGRYCVSNPL